MKINQREKKAVCQIIDNYLSFSQNWLYRQIKGLPQFPPLILSWGGITNRRYFPLKDIYLAYRGEKSTLQEAEFYFKHGFWPKMAHLIEKFQPSLLHAHFGPNGVAALALKRYYNLPLITSFYGYDAGVCGRHPYWQKAYSELFNSGDIFLVEGPQMKSYLYTLGCPYEKIVIQRLGIDLKKIKFSPKKIEENQPFYVVIAARVVEKKGHFTGLRAFTRLARYYPEARLKIIGEGELLAAVKELANELGIRDKTTFIPSLAYLDYLKEVQSCHIFLQPSQTAKDGDMEGGAPIGLLEAQALGLGIVATQHADIPSYVLVGKTGFLASEKDWESLAAYLMKLASTPELLSSQIIKGRKHVEENYNLIEQRKKLAAIYQEVINVKRSKPASFSPYYYLPFLEDAAAITLRADKSAAQKIYQLILELDKNNLNALRQLGAITEENNEPAKSAAYWEMVLKISEEHLEKEDKAMLSSGKAAFHWGYNLLKLAQFEEAETAFRKAIKYFPENYLAYYHLASILKRRGEVREASFYFQEFLIHTEAEVMQAKTLFHLGEIAFLENQFTLAKKHLEDCLVKMPQHQTALKLLKEIENLN